MNKKISVIVPAYNVEKYLRRCLDSLVYQTYPHLEILVIDDGSTDGTRGIIEEYVSRFAGKVQGKQQRETTEFLMRPGIISDLSMRTIL